ncbi:hypothetical protein LJC10_03260 [Selenomonadales bacterium OttesenSCG-928-I06]|nr:hypothetical protein [Selenomonadales bacterium OttesenSCG-928-I06]
MSSNLKELIKENKKKFSLDFLKKNNMNKKLVLIGLLGIVLIIVGSVVNLEEPQKIIRDDSVPLQGITATEFAVSKTTYEEKVENKLANLLAQIKGAGQVSVNITLENEASFEHAKNVSKEVRTIEEKDSTGGVRTTTENKTNEQILVSRENGIDRPVIAKEYKPVIKGVVIVAEGGADSRVKANITKAVERGLGLAPHKIVVLPQRK